MGIIDLEGESFRYVVVNPSAAAILGKTPKELKGKRPEECGIGESIALEFAQKIRASSTNTTLSFEIDALNFGVYSCIAFHDRGNRYHFLAVDITENRKLTNELKEHQEHLENLVKARTIELEEALQVKGRFLAIMSHEMRTPLTGLTGALHLLAETKLDEEQRELTNISEVCGEQLLVVINDVLDLSKMEENKMTLENVPVEIIKLMEDSLDVVALEAQKKGIEMIVQVQREIPSEIIGDAVRIRQILVNLLTNAVKFTGIRDFDKNNKIERGEVTLTASSRCFGDSKCEFIFSVQDTGIGIKECAKSQIFKPFTQADTSITRRYHGSGLGLAISKKLAELMEGSMYFDSEENVGSTFYFKMVSWIPRAKKEEVFVPIKESVDNNLLIVVHNPKLLEALKDFCTNLGFSSIVGLTSPSEAMNLTVSFHIALIEVPESEKTIPNEFMELLEKLTSSKCVTITTGARVHESHLRYLKKPIKLRLLRKAIIDTFVKESKESTPSEFVSPAKNHTEKSQLKILVAEDNTVNQKIIIKLLRSLGY